MACKLYTDLNEAFAVVQAQAIPLDNSRDFIIQDLLTASSGTVTIDNVVTTAYRPYVVAAHMLHTSKLEQTTTRAEGDAQFRYADNKANLEPAIISNLRLQQSLDFGCNLTVPYAWNAQTILDQFCGCLDDGKAVGLGGNYAFGAISA